MGGEEGWCGEVSRLSNQGKNKLELHWVKIGNDMKLGQGNKRNTPGTAGGLDRTLAVKRGIISHTGVSPKWVKS